MFLHIATAQANLPSRHTSMLALSNKMNDGGADGHYYIALPGFTDLERLVAHIFLAMDHFLDRSSTFSEQMKKIYRLGV